MAAFFKNILIPVDLSANSEIALRKALAFADAGTHIHLFHVIRYSKTDIGGKIQRYFYELTERPVFMQAEIKMNKWRDSMCQDRPDIAVSVWIIEADSIQKAIENKAVELNADLMILVKQSHGSFLPLFNTVKPALISQNTGGIVLLLKADESKAMVVPITTDTTLSEKELISIICKKSESKIHLVTFISNGNEQSANVSSLLQVYKWLCAVQTNVDYAALRGSNKTKAIVNFAARVHADTVIFHQKTDLNIEYRKNSIPESWHGKSEYLLGEAG